MKLLSIVLLILLNIPLKMPAQTCSVPSIRLITPEGDHVMANGIQASGHPVLLVFWNLCDGDCVKQIEALVSIQDEYLKEYGVRLIGVFEAAGGNWSLVKPFVSGKSWDIELYIDTNSDLATAMSIPDLPYTILYGAEMQKVCSHVGYCSGMDDLLCEKVKACLQSQVHH